MADTVSISPLIYLGIIIYIVPVILGIVRVSVPSWIGMGGLIFLGIGIMHTIWLRR